MFSLRKNLSNAIGWTTRRKIVVIESDDWGSIRTRSKKDYDAMLAKGLEVDRSNFTKFDCLESNSDLENLFDLLYKHKDSTGRPAVFTPMCIMANPDFNKIRDNGFKKYYYERVDNTIEAYPNHNKVITLWKEGISKRLFVPGFHGREHLNVCRWMKNIKDNNPGAMIAFEHESMGATWYKNHSIPEYLGAFHTHSETELEQLKNILKDGIDIFDEICGFKPTHFIAPNMEPRIELDKVLSDNGIYVQTMSKLRKFPKNNDKYGFELNWMGKLNKEKQRIITRNCHFEPSDPRKNDWVISCIEEISNAFKYKKPAIVSTHRVNYIGSISQGNADKGLKELDKLVTTIIEKWPAVEFMTSTEWGLIIKRSKLK